MLGVELVCVFLPQTELFVPFAAFFVAVCLVLCIFDAARKAALCILLGAVVGMASVLHTANRLERIRVQYAGRPLMLTAEVESTADSYDPGIVDAVLHVEKVNGSAESFRVECSALPECKAGERVQGRFILSAPASGSRSMACRSPGGQMRRACLTSSVMLVPSCPYSMRPVQMVGQKISRPGKPGRQGSCKEEPMIGAEKHLNEICKSGW